LTDTNTHVAADIISLHRMIDVVHDYVRTTQERAFEARAAAYNSSHSPISYPIDSKVLVHFNQRLNKLLPHYRGPFTVTSMASDNIYNVRDIHGTSHRVHITRLRSFDDSRLTPEDEEELWCPDGFTLVDSIVGHRLNADGTYHFHVKWRGYPDNASEVTWAEMGSVAHTAQFKLYVSAHSDINFSAAPLFAKRVIRKPAAAPSGKPAAKRRGRPPQKHP
jgi:hypothetical protein